MGGVADQKADGSIAFGLECKNAFKLQRSGQNRRQRERFSQQTRDRLRVIMLANNFINRRAQPYQPAMQVRRVQQKRQDKITFGRTRPISYDMHQASTPFCA